MFSTKRAWHFGLLLVGLSTLLATQAHAAGIAWRTSLPAALKEAQRTHKPVFLDFTAMWCEPCLTMKQRVFTDKRAIGALRQWIPVHVDVDKQTATAMKYKVGDLLPTMIALTPRGAVVAQTAGYLDAKGLTAWLRANYAKARR
jgi:thiol:disulfide interchange protein